MPQTNPNNNTTATKRRYRRLRTLKALPDFSGLTPECSDPALILESAHGTASALFKAYQLLVKQRAPSRGGMTTDEEQDLLRAMLVMTGAGLDGTAKELIRKSLHALVKKDPEVLKGLQSFIETQILKKNEKSAASFIAKVFVADDHVSQVIEAYIQELTGGSLQSAEEMLSTANALGIKDFAQRVDIKKLKTVFEVRNKIIHELDMNLSGTRRKRNIRNQTEMTKHVEFLFHTAATLLEEVSKKVI